MEVYIDAPSSKKGSPIKNKCVPNYISLPFIYLTLFLIGDLQTYKTQKMFKMTETILTCIGQLYYH